MSRRGASVADPLAPELAPDGAASVGTRGLAGLARARKPEFPIPAGRAGRPYAHFETAPFDRSGTSPRKRCRSASMIRGRTSRERVTKRGPRLDPIILARRPAEIPAYPTISPGRQSNDNAPAAILAPASITQLEA